MIEAYVKRKVKSIIADYERAGHVFWSYWPVQTGYGKHGIPDCLLSVNGHMVAIETKVNGKQPTARQWYELLAIQKARGIVLVIDQHNLGDIAHVFAAILGGNVAEASRRATLSIYVYKHNQ